MLIFFLPFSLVRVAENGKTQEFIIIN